MENRLELVCDSMILNIVQYSIAGFNVAPDTSYRDENFTEQMTQPKCHSTEAQWLVNQVKSQTHQAQLTKRYSKECNKKLIQYVREKKL